LIPIFEAYVIEITMGSLVLDERTYLLSKEPLVMSSYGRVYLATSEAGDERVIVKVLSEENREMAQKEYANLAKLDHPNIVKVYGLVEHELGICIVMEYLEGDCLFDLIVDSSQLSEEEAVRYTLQIASALDYLHQQGVCHRDVKPDNIIVFDSIAKLIDFGYSETVTDPRVVRIWGTPGYIAPELLELVVLRDLESYQASLGELCATDAFSLGVTLFVMLYGCFPYLGKDSKGIYYQILHGQTYRHRNKYRTVPVSKEIKSLIDYLLDRSPDTRFTVKQLIRYLERHALKRDKNVHQSTIETSRHSIAA
jgi:serine/threonine protein kinase